MFRSWKLFVIAKWIFSLSQVIPRHNDVVGKLNCCLTCHNLRWYDETMKFNPLRTGNNSLGRRHKYWHDMIAITCETRDVNRKRICSINFGSVSSSKFCRNASCNLDLALNKVVITFNIRLQVAIFRFWFGYFFHHFCFLWCLCHAIYAVWIFFCLHWRVNCNCLKTAYLTSTFNWNRFTHLMLESSWHNSHILNFSSSFFLHLPPFPLFMTLTGVERAEKKSFECLKWKFIESPSLFRVKVTLRNPDIHYFPKIFTRNGSPSPWLWLWHDLWIQNHFDG